MATTAIIVALSATQVAWSQDRGGPPGSGDGPPPVMPGGGPGGPMRGPFVAIGTTRAALLQMPEVQKELALTPEQLTKANAVLDGIDDAMRRVMGDVDFRDLEPEERDAKMAELRTAVEAANKSADEKFVMILDAKQWERLGQLRLQRDPLGVLLAADVQKALGLDAAQIEKLTAMRANARPFGGPPGMRGREDVDPQSVLTDAQRATFDAMKGAEFKFPQRGFGGPGGPGGPMQEERKVLKEFDKDGDGRLNREERAAARAAMKERGDGGGGPGRRGPGGRGPGGRGGFGPPGMEGGDEPGSPGPKVAPSDVKPVDAPLYDASVVRTIFIDFDVQDWEAELSDFYHTDVDVPATLTVDGKTYPNVGVRFRGASSYFMVPAGSKRSLNVAVDLADSKQRLDGYATLNLLNAHEDPTFMHTVLYFDIARHYLAAPKANFVRVVVNGESWGLFVNAQQYDKRFLAEHFGGKDGPGANGVRWKVPGSPNGRGGLEYLGDDLAAYKARYAMKGVGDDASDKAADAWKRLIALCRTLNETPLDQLESALAPVLDIDGALWFLALETTLVNNDGYWIRASDYAIYLDPRGVFHIIPHDANETFGAAGGPGMPGGPGGPGGRRGGGGQLDPLIGLDDSTKPLRSRLLAVPSLRQRYLEHVRTIANDWLDWSKLSPVVDRYRALIEKEVEADTRKLSSFAAFKRSVAAEDAASDGEPGRPGRRGSTSLKSFADERRAYLLSLPAIKELPQPTSPAAPTKR
ncbi:MAG: CotH kinase family protein [Phycisphaerales bacterium]